MVHRVVFSEITPRAIKEAVAQPRKLSMDLVNAQQARRALDYLVGFNLSPVLWRKVQRGLSAGRVQSPALRMIVEREEEIEAFKAREYWSIEADCAHPDQPFNARLWKLRGKKFEQFDLVNENDAHAARDALKKAAQAARDLNHAFDWLSEEETTRIAHLLDREDPGMGSDYWWVIWQLTDSLCWLGDLPRPNPNPGKKTARSPGSGRGKQKGAQTAKSI